MNGMPKKSPTKFLASIGKSVFSYFQSSYSSNVLALFFGQSIMQSIHKALELKCPSKFNKVKRLEFESY